MTHAYTYSQKLLKTIDRDKASPIFDYKELFKQQDSIYSENVFDIALKKTFNPGTLRVSFDPGTVTFYRSNLNVVTNLIDMLSGVAIEHFARCEHCGKWIFVSRANKRFCPGCGAKKYQKDKWQQDPEGMREKERVRYREKRKKS